jgi:hypothetical protein
MASRQYREMRQRIKINKQSGSYVVIYPAAGHPGYSKEKVFSPAIGFNAYAKARQFAKIRAICMCLVSNLFSFNDDIQEAQQ